MFFGHGSITASHCGELITIHESLVKYGLYCPHCYLNAKYLDKSCFLFAADAVVSKHFHDAMQCFIACFAEHINYDFVLMLHSLGPCKCLLSNIGSQY